MAGKQPLSLQMGCEGPSRSADWAAEMLARDAAFITPRVTHEAIPKHNY